MINGNEQMQRFAQAARDLMEKGVVDSSDGRFSHAIFWSVRQGSSAEVRNAVVSAAAECDITSVMLEFGHTATAKGPLSFTASTIDPAGGAETTGGCALAVDADGRFILVPRGPVATTFHFAVGEHGLERRHGRPANLGAGIVRAARELVAAARRAPLGSPGITIAELDAA